MLSEHSYTCLLHTVGLMLRCRAEWEKGPIVCEVEISTTYLAFNKKFADPDLGLSWPVFPYTSPQTLMSEDIPSRILQS